MLKTCTRCKGTGKMMIQFINHTDDTTLGTSGPCDLPCFYCDGSGEDIGKQFIEELIDWCQCGEDNTFGGYPGDGECDCGVYKHHVHCGTCGNISQIG